jgi:two-component system, cell cycle sensor histidine kinase and response regulator CckA
VLGIFWDVTEQRALEAQLRQVQKMDAIGHLAGGIAHDFNNLLTGILGNVSLALSTMPEHDSHRELIAAAENATLRAAELVRKLLGFSRRTLLRLEVVHLNTVVAETLGIIRPALHPGIELVLRDAADLWTVRADPSQLSQVLLNLSLNARDAMPERGVLSLSTQNVTVTPEQAQRQVQARAGEFVLLRVEDTGCGIPAEVLPRIFEPFFTTKEPGKGTGLGLAMVAGIVGQHQGWVECHSVANEGTRFDVYLPRHVRSSVTVPAPVTPAAPTRGDETILLVDDEPLVRNLGKLILERSGYRVLIAEDGLAALEVYQQRKEEIALVILDLTMPRLSGAETLDRLVAVDPEVKVVFSSGYSADLAPVARPGQACGFVGKPYRPEDLAKAVRNAIDQPRAVQRRNGKRRRPQAVN